MNMSFRFNKNSKYILIDFTSKLYKSIKMISKSQDTALLPNASSENLSNNTLHEDNQNYLINDAQESVNNNYNNN